ncbi:phosphatidate cytidylyltransferase [bacterium]|nr:MAG: phosphatidate cytidylyltransferase [bacterium]
MTPNLLAYVLWLFTGLFLIGTLLCLALYKWDAVRYFKSQLWIKTYYWIPIFCLFLGVNYGQLLAALLAVLVVSSLSIRELYKLPARPWYAVAYTSIILASITHLPLFFIQFSQTMAAMLLLIVGFSSVLSDVCAYFFGNFIGRHKLPNWINPNKSWEGVAGQLIGACVGFILIAPAFDQAPSVILAVAIGLASAFGDILNSIVKRQLGIKDWGMTIPGHGGMLDRFASLAFAIAATYWFAKLLL